jgi:hypothetical protein
MREGGETPWAKAGLMFTLATCRPPDAKEMAVLLDAYDGHLAEFRKAPESASQLVQVGDTKPDPSLDPVELAAWTMVGNVILNLDEVVSKP